MVDAAPQLIRRSDGEEVPERLDEMLVGDEQVLVCRAVQHDRPLLAALERELADQAALPHAGFAGDEGEPGTLTVAGRDPQLAQKIHLALAAHEARLGALPEPGGQRKVGAGHPRAPAEPGLAIDRARARPSVGTSARAVPSRTSCARLRVSSETDIPSSRRKRSRSRPYAASAPARSPERARRAIRSRWASSASGSSAARLRVEAIAPARSPSASACAARRSRSSDRRSRCASRCSYTHSSSSPASSSPRHSSSACSSLPAASCAEKAAESIQTFGGPSRPTRSRVAIERLRRLGSERSAQRPQRVAQARSCARVQHLRPEPRGHFASRMAARVEREPREQRSRAPRAGQLDRPPALSTRSSPSTRTRSMPPPYPRQRPDHFSREL